MYFSYENLKLRYEPFPIGLARPIMESGVYNEFLENYPPLDRFFDYQAHGKYGIKFTLSEREDPRTYHRYIRSNPVWREFYRWIKSDEFIYDLLNALKDHFVDLGYTYHPPLRRLAKRVKEIRRGHLCRRVPRLSSRFEFSALPANGGEVVPHTDSPSKIATVIVSMTGEGEWDPAYGGGTDMNRPKHTQHMFNHVNHLAKFEDMDVIQTFDFEPNQAVIFVRTFNSWHSVRPMTGKGSAAMRRTLTIVIEDRG